MNKIYKDSSLFTVFDKGILYNNSDINVNFLSVKESLNILNKFDYNKIKLNKKLKTETKQETDELYDDNYNKPWSKLDKFQKINRLIHYINKLNLNTEEKTNLKLLLIESINEKKLKNKDEIIYDSEKGIIIEILNLNKNINNNYYIKKDITNIDIVKTEVKNISTFKKLDIKSMFKKQ